MSTPPCTTDTVFSGAGDGFVPKRRNMKKAMKRVRTPCRDHPINFVFENPLDGAFKNMHFTKSIMNEYPKDVFMKPTSYCHYGFDYMKRTVFIGTLRSFNPAMPCRANPCTSFKLNGHHLCQVKGQSASLKNSIPAKLIDLEIEAWMSEYPDPLQRFLIIDVFAGYGSVVDRIKAKYPKVKVYANDIVKRKDNNVELDITKFPMTFLFKLALNKHFGDPVLPDMPQGIVQWLRGEKIAVLFHLSTPCNTYSVDGMGVNRYKDTLEPRSELAFAHDNMNTKLIEWLNNVCFKHTTEVYE